MAARAPAEFHCWHAGNADEARQKGRFLLSLYSKYLKDGPIVDLGCGEGALVLSLQQAGFRELLGVESNSELCGQARALGVPVVQSDLLEYFRAAKRAPAVYLYLDVIEHVPYEYNAALFSQIPVGSRLIIQTPNTESLLGHEYYFRVPSHLAPYSPWVMEKMLGRLGYEIHSQGALDLYSRNTGKNKLRRAFIRRVLGVEPDLLMGGGNYYVVADRVREAG